MPLANKIYLPTNQKYIPLNDVNSGPESTIGASVNSSGAIVTATDIGSARQVATAVAEAAMSNQEYLLSTTNLVNLNQAPETNLFTAPAGITGVVITRVVVRKASTSLTTASLAFGWNAGTDNDVIATATHTELTGNTLFTILIPKIGAKLGVASGVFSVITTILQGGAATASIDVFGYILP